MKENVKPPKKEEAKEKATSPPVEENNLQFDELGGKHILMNVNNISHQLGCAIIVRTHFRHLDRGQGSQEGKEEST